MFFNPCSSINVFQSMFLNLCFSIDQTMIALPGGGKRGLGTRLVKCTTTWPSTQAFCIDFLSDFKASCRAILLVGNSPRSGGGEEVEGREGEEGEREEREESIAAVTESIMGDERCEPDQSTKLKQAIDMLSSITSGNASRGSTSGGTSGECSS